MIERIQQGMNEHVVIWEIQHSFHFSQCSFSNFPRKSRYQNMFLFFVYWETNTKVFFAVTVKSNFNMRTSLFMETVLFLLHMHMNYLETRFFSPKSIGVIVFFFSIGFITLSLFWPEFAYINIRFSRDLIHRTFSIFLFRKSLVNL